MKILSKLTLAIATTALLAAAPLAEAQARPHDHHGGWHGGDRGHHGWHRRHDRHHGYSGAAFGLGALTGALLSRPYYYEPRHYYYPRPVYYSPRYYAPPSRTVVIYR